MRTVTLNNGVEMPVIGLGTYKITDPEVCEQCVVDAAQMGYRLFDTAQIYGNEEAVGKGLKRSGVPRKELFVTTKLWYGNYETVAARAAMEESMRKLGLDYIDLVLLHWPFCNTYAAWRMLEEMVHAGAIRAIGVANYTASQLIDLSANNEIKPAVNQVETHLLAQQQELSKWMQKLNIFHQSYSSFGHGQANEMFDLPVVQGIAKAHGKTGRQIALRYLVQKGMGVIPKSTHKDRIAENFDIFDFELTEDEMAKLQALDKNEIIIGKPLDPANAWKRMIEKTIPVHTK